MILPHSGVECTRITGHYTEAAEVELFVARFDKVHPLVSGNKLFKLHYFLERALLEKRPVVTFGGPYSNHLSATAYACRKLGIKCTGIVNGDHQFLTHTMEQCASDNMNLIFIPRDEYRKIKTSPTHELYPEAIVIPEGGFHTLGVKGAALMPLEIEYISATHTCISAGTATTLGGFLSSFKGKAIAVPAIKNMNDIPARLRLLEVDYDPEQLDIWENYHFGGFAKITPTLLAFMKDFSDSYEIQLDRVYTAKLLFGVIDKIRSGYFEPGSRIICVHTGGLQGNGPQLSPES